MDSSIKRAIIMQHYQKPFHKGLKEDSNYVKIKANNESCIDNLDLIVKFNGDIIEDICFDGEACAISTSSTSIMIHELIGKTKKEALEFIENYENMINEKEYNEELLGECIVYDDIYKQPNRKKCALLSFLEIKKLLTKS